MRARVVFLLALTLLTSCYRTHYENFSPANPNRAPLQQPTPRHQHGSGWRSFFLWGWVPSEIVIDARTACGGAENVDSIETRRTFVEGLVAAFAGFYVNIYSPYNGAVFCRPPAPAPVAPPPPSTPPPAP